MDCRQFQIICPFSGEWNVAALFTRVSPVASIMTLVVSNTEVWFSINTNQLAGWETYIFQGLSKLIEHGYLPEILLSHRDRIISEFDQVMSVAREREERQQQAQREADRKAWLASKIERAIELAAVVILAVLVAWILWRAY
jgi:hypothetical protein